jgi:AraC family transcriptional regulator
VPEVNEVSARVDIAGATSRLEASRTTALGRVQVLHRRWAGPIDIVSFAPEYWLQLTLLPAPGNARGCFPDRWGPRRFEPIGKMFLLPAGQRVHARNNGDHSQRSIACAFPPNSLRSWFDGEFTWTDSRLVAGLDILNPAIRNQLLLLGTEACNPGFAGDALLEFMMGEIAIRLARHCMAIPESRTTGGLAPWRLRLIDDRLAVEGSSPSLTELAKLCGISARQLTRGFRASRGTSIGSYIINSRVDLAKRCLLAGASVKDIARRLGFSSTSNFYISFRRATGETPRDYRLRAGQ